MILDHTDPRYIESKSRLGADRYNGALYYSQEIVANIIPKVETSRSWVTVNVPGIAFDHSVVFVHNNQHTAIYEWLEAYDDVVMVCGVPSTVDKVSHIHPAVYLPLSVDVDYVQSFRRYKDRDVAFVGRRSKAEGFFKTGEVPAVSGMPREELLAEVARYKRVYAVGRCAIEAKVLGCEVLPYDPRYPDPSVWQIVDNSEAAAVLQGILDKIDR